MTKPILLVKISYKLSVVIQGVKNIFDKVTSWPQADITVIGSTCLYMFTMLASHFYTQDAFVLISISITTSYICMYITTLWKDIKSCYFET